MGIGLFWKPSGIGSQDFLKNIRRQLNLPKAKRGRSEIGHTGTLDPFAEGLLCVGWGEGTKLLAPLFGAPKTYLAEFVFGATTDTLDPTGLLGEPPLEKRREIEYRLKVFIEDQTIRLDFLKSCLGFQLQRPPEYSAIQIKGQRCYDLIRHGQISTQDLNQLLESRSREILVKNAHEVREPFWADSGILIKTVCWTVELEVSSGTYVRALARDFGQKLVGFPGYLKSLKRTAISNWRASFDGSQWRVPILDFEELQKSFKVLRVNSGVAEKVQSYGQFNDILFDPKNSSLEIERGSKPVLIINSDNDSPVAWLESFKPFKVGRVFVEDPIVDVSKFQTLDQAAL